MSFLVWLKKKGLDQKIAASYVSAIELDTVAKLLKIVEQPSFDKRQLNRGPYFTNFCKKFDSSKLLLQENEEMLDLYRCALMRYAEYCASISIAPPAMLFPEGLLEWAGHRNGGVRRPFDKKSGRPTGKQIITPLTTRLTKWVQHLVAGKSVPRAIILVGGPGNGKTDAVEGCINTLDEELNALGELFDSFASPFKESHASPPRRVEVDLSQLSIEIPKCLSTTIVLVQDATERDTNQSESPEELLLNELSSISNEAADYIYIACVNRGILAKTLELAEERQVNSEVVATIHSIMECVTLDANPKRCWPLEQNLNLAVWPMDVESLLDAELSNDGRTVCHEIFEAALNKEFWKDPCQLQEMCPYCQNRLMLERPQALDNLIHFLYYFELSSGKRWTFRDLFSLISYLLVGTNSELEINGKRHSPCGWSARQLDYVNNNQKDSVEKDRAPYLMASRLYHHRLFPLWPGLSRGEHLKARNMLSSRSLEPGISNTLSLLKFTRYSKSETSRAVGDIPNLILHKFSSHLDPAAMSCGQTIHKTATTQVSVFDLEDRFSLSIEDGAALIKGAIHPLEEKILEDLSTAERSLGELKRTGNSAKSAATLQASIKRFASRLVKRSLGTRLGICNNKELFESYSNIVASDEQALNNARKGLKKILNGNKNKFHAELTTTFGQPVAQISRQASLILDTAINVKLVNHTKTDAHPKTYLPFLEVEGHHIPITFDLFKALSAIEQGLFTASLSSEVYSLLDRVQALVAGRVVRDPDVIGDDPTILLGNMQGSIELVSGKFLYSERSPI